MAILSNELHLKTWLESQSTIVTGVIASRMALRVLPVIYMSVGGVRLKDKQAILLLFRANTTARTAAIWPSPSMIALARSTKVLTPVSALPAATAQASLFAAFTQAFSDQSVLAAVRTAAMTVSAAGDDAAAIWKAIEVDANHVDGIMRPVQLANLPLWEPGALAQSVPPAFAENWQTLKSDLLAAKEDWDVWTDWYEDRLAGKRPRWKDVEIYRVTLNEEADWEQSPAYVNALIKAKIEEKLAEEVLKRSNTERTLSTKAKHQPKPRAKTALGKLVIENGQALVEKIDLLIEAIDLRREDLEAHKPNEEIEYAAWKVDHDAILDLVQRVRLLDLAVKDFLNCQGPEEKIQPEVISVANSLKVWWHKHDQEVINSGWRFARKSGKLGVIVASAGVGALFGAAFVTAPAAIAIIGGDKLIEQMKKIKLPHPNSEQNPPRKSSPASPKGEGRGSNRRSKR